MLYCNNIYTLPSKYHKHHRRGRAEENRIRKWRDRRKRWDEIREGRVSASYMIICTYSAHTHTKRRGDNRGGRVLNKLLCIGQEARGRWKIGRRRGESKISALIGSKRTCACECARGPKSLIINASSWWSRSRVFEMFVLIIYIWARARYIYTYIQDA